MSDEFDMSENDEEGDAQWISLNPTERKELLKNVFSDGNWYDGTAFFEGGDIHPPFDEISQRVGADKDTIRKYYIAWLKARGYDNDTIKTALTSGVDPLSGVTVVSQSTTGPQPSAAYQQEVNRMEEGAFSQPTQDPILSLQPPKGSSESDSMFSMMQFLGMQQQISARQQHQAQMMAMEQRRLDQSRESELRREAQARDQQFSMQQMAFMREMLRTKDNDGFFDSDMKTIFKQRMVEQMLDGGQSTGALERIASRLLQPEMLGTIASAASSILPTRNQVPAGYDSPNYDPYAQPVQVAQQAPIPVQQAPVLGQEAPPQYQQPEEPSDNFFEGPEQEEVDVEISPEQYKHALLEQFKQIMGADLEDPKTLSAIQEQIDLTVDNICVEYSSLAPQTKLDKMAERMILVRSLRDIGRGMQDALSKIEEGTDEDIVYSFISSELKKNDVFWNIFRTNTYEELLGIIEPYKDSGGVIHDYNFLLRADVAAVCQKILTKVQSE